MGCDIHLMTERFRNINGEGRWVSIDHFKYNPYYGEEYESELCLVPVYRKRNYNLFSFLANVRNYSGNSFISNPKGIPKDASEITKKESESWRGDGHSHSYFTLQELKVFLSENPMQKYQGYMIPSDAELVDKGEMPGSWWQDGNVPNQVYREWEYKNTALDDLLEAIEKRKKEEFWIFDDEERPEFDDKVRIVFWFDN